MIIKELQLLSEALWNSIQDDQKLFSSIQTFAHKLSELKIADKSDILEAELYYNKIESFFYLYRKKPGGDIFYSSPTQIATNEDSLHRIGEIISELKRMPEAELNKIIPKTKGIQKPLEKSSVNSSHVFIVHGHDETAKTKTARFVEKLGFEAIILHEQASSSQTIIEKIETYSDVGFAIILYTPCDIGGKQIDSPDLKPRARQNVVFEHGFFIGKIGRGKVCALVKGKVETPKDISGVVYVNMDDAEAWCYTIAKEMKKAGYDINMNKL